MMYRDDREALRDEVVQLKRELEQARGDQERLVEVEKRLEAANRELASLRAQIDPTRAQRRSSPMLVIAVGVVLCLAALGAFVLTARSSRSVTVPAPPPIQQADTTANAPPTAPTTPAPSAVAAPSALATPQKSAHAIWHATVTRSQGLPLAAGSPCTVEANVVADANGLEVDDVVVKCGARVLFDDAAELEGMASVDSDAKQFTGEKKGTWTYAIVYSDVGTRGPSRNQIMVDSTKQLGKVWSDNLPDFRVDFAIKEKSDPANVAVLDR